MDALIGDRLDFTLFSIFPADESNNNKKNMKKKVIEMSRVSV